MSIKVLLRFILALAFAALAVIFSELLPFIEGVNIIFLRVSVTIIAFLIGFLVFPDLASKVTTYTITAFNFLVNSISSEVLSQIVKLPTRPNNWPFITHTPAVGTVSLQRPLILDTSAVIDGRILDIAKTGFILGTVLIPTFVLTELQQVADSADFLRRNRGRRGFEIIDELKKTKNISIEIWDKDSNGKGVDDKLLSLAKNLHGRILTTDFNLNRVAAVSGISVLNINELANAVKTVAIPGEKLEVKIMHIGKDADQGIGYLPDGTMIVVQSGANLMGKTIDAEVTKIIQNPAGRMIFAKKVIHRG